MHLRRPRLIGVRLGLALLCSVLAAAAAPEALAGPPDRNVLDIFDPSQPVIPPGREALARGLLADVPEHPAAGFGGPTIEMDAIVFELRGADDALLASVRLEPENRAEPGEPTSESFVIRTTLAEGVERETLLAGGAATQPLADGAATQPLADGAATQTVAVLLDAAIASVQAHDEGGFYVHAELTPRVDRPHGAAEGWTNTPAPEPDRAGNRALWAGQTGALALILLVGTALLLRAPSKPEPPGGPA